jgi:hypothetical protein
MSSSSTANQVYSDVASFGRGYAFIGAIFATVIGVLLLGGGIYFIQKEDPDKGQATGKITQILSDACKGGSKNNPSCKYMVKFQAPDPHSPHKEKKYTASVFSFHYYQVGDTTEVFYNPDNPSQAELNKKPYKMVGGLMLAISAFVIFGSWLNYYLSRRYKFYAAAGGVAGGLNLVENAIRA